MRHRDLVWMKVRWMGEEGDGANERGRGYITTVLPTVDNIGRREGGTSGKRMAGKDEGRLDQGECVCGIW